MQHHRIDTETRGDIRTFAFWLGNGTLIPVNEDFDFDYELCILQDSSNIGKVFSVYLNNMRAHSNGTITYDPPERAAQWLFNHCNPGYNVENPFDSWELDGYEPERDVFDAIKKFAFQFGNGLVEEDILQNIEYMPYLFEGGSLIESIFAVFTNVLQIDAQGNAINSDYARHRTAQFIRTYFDETYQAHPPFEEWETELA